MDNNNLIDMDEAKLRQTKHFSSSDEDVVDTSDELISDFNVTGHNHSALGPEPSTSRGVNNEKDGQYCIPTVEPAVAHAEQMIRNAKTLRAQILATPANTHIAFSNGMNVAVTSKCRLEMNNFLHSAMVDEEYLAIRVHVKESLQKKILANEYIDFARLLPRDKLGMEEDNCMEMVKRGGMSFWVPLSDRENSGALSSFGKWEQAFRVFSNIYNAKYPECATKLIQYSHIIYPASQTYILENVYQYDKEFRLHLSRHPQRSWSIILQQAFNLKLKEKLTHGHWEPCRCYNKEKCTKGARCRYKHRCTIPTCGKFRHGTHIRRKRNTNTNNSFQDNNDANWTNPVDCNGSNNNNNNTCKQHVKK